MDKLQVIDEINKLAELVFARKNITYDIFTRVKEQNDTAEMEYYRGVMYAESEELEDLFTLVRRVAEL